MLDEVRRPDALATHREPPATPPPEAPGEEDGFPFFLSLSPLAAWWREVAEGRRPGDRAQAEGVLHDLARVSELAGPVREISLLEGHRELVDKVIAPMFAPALDDRVLAAAFLPYPFRIIRATSAFRRTQLDAAGGSRVRETMDARRLQVFKMLCGYAGILRRFYSLDLPLDASFVISLHCPEEGIERSFQYRFTLDFVEIRAPNGPPLLDDEARRCITHDLTDIDLLRQLLPPHRFVFEGLAFIEAFDVTDQQAMSSLKQELIDQDSLLCTERLAVVEKKIRSLLRLPDLSMRVGALHANEIYVFDPPCQPASGVAGQFDGEAGEETAVDMPAAPMAGAALEIAPCLGVGEYGGVSLTASTKPTLFEDLHALSCLTPRQAALKAMGFRACLFVPLVLNGNVIGLLELASPHVGDLDAARLLRLEGAIPLFAVAVQRLRDSVSMKVQAIIKQEFTSIHPAVEWRFRRAALSYMRRGEVEGTMETILFPNVYPLFGVSDIRSSSVLRNQAIQADLLEQLAMARHLLDLAYRARALPYLGNLIFSVEQKMARIEPGLGSGDEQGIVEFLGRDIEPMFARLEEFGPEVREALSAYWRALDPDIRILYRKRRNFDQSVGLIADALASLLEEEQARAQRIFPHYYEMHKTDGVDHSIYIGASLAEDPSRFDLLYLRNLRLWQLIAMCQAARRAEEIRPTLPMPLETAHLVLVQSAPLSIRFHPEEKAFNVDGAYNVRYEIVKKRLDKAEIRGTGERLTQPRQVAIVYAQPREAEEYRGYLEYVVARGYAEPTVEEHEVAELQGVQGLKALRVKVRMPGS